MPMVVQAAAVVQVTFQLRTPAVGSMQEPREQSLLHAA